MNKLKFKSGLSVLAVACLAASAHAQVSPSPSPGLASAAQKAITNNPEVTARLNALRAAANEVDVARGEYYPTVDLTANVGRENNRITSRLPESQSLNRNGIALNATQMLWDGLATRREVERLGHARLTRYFEFLAASEDAALEASRAYIDVVRFRRLVDLAEDNYVQHKYAFDQLQLKYKAGVGRGVDSEQANARLALADSNLTTELANLHDVSARFLRVVGEAPATQLPPTDGLNRGLTDATGDASNQALARNASISAAVENLRAVQAQAQGRDSAFQPRLEARARTGVGRNFDGIQDQKRDTTAEIVMTWNLFNGGSDQARVRQYANLVSQAADQRDRACRDVRQTIAIAHNDIRKLRDQISALDRNVLAIEKARDAYRQQFDIGQRSLLDLLNSENELYTAKRSYANAEYDLQLAYARTQAARNTLTSTLGLTREDEGSAELAKDWQAANDAAQRCGAATVDAPAINREELDARARKLAIPASPATTTPVAAPAVLATKPLTPAANAALQTVNQRLGEWAAAWIAKDPGRYFTYYAKDFAPLRSTSATWINERRRLLAKTGPIDLKLDNVKLTPQGETVVTTFEQTYTSSNFKDRTAKVLTWKQIGGQWVIIKESNR